MAQYEGTSVKKSITIKGTDSSEILTYLDIMKDAGLYVTKGFLTEEERERNQNIKDTESFNIVSYAFISKRSGGLIRELSINDKNYSFFKFNDITMQDAIDFKSIALYDISQIEISAVPVPETIKGFENSPINVFEAFVSYLETARKLRRNNLVLPKDISDIIDAFEELEISYDVLKLDKELKELPENTAEENIVYYAYCFPIYLYLTISYTFLNNDGEYETEYYPLYYKLVNTYIKTAESEEEKEEEEEEEGTPEDTEVEDIIDDNPDIEEVLLPNEDFDPHLNLTVTAVNVPPEQAKYIYFNSISLAEWITKPILSPSNILVEGEQDNDNHLITNDTLIRVHFDEKCSVPLNVTLYATDSNNNNYNVTYNYTPSKISISGNAYERIQKMNGPNVSYGLLRVNPKLTGNIKVVVDEKSNIYLDTFKVSKSLEQKRFRHVKVNSNEYYGQTLMARYKDIPTTDFYKIEDKCYNLFTTAQTYNSQYYDLYRYGVKTNDDNMYSENFALLAPLCIKEILPDFFVIFKVDTTDKEYDESWSDTDKMNYFIKNGKVIKSYDMRKGSVLGDYVRTIYERSKEYPGDAYLSYSTTNHNKYIGISVERGVVISAYESPFAEEGIKSQVAMNDFYTKGFERNHLVSKNIINFEYMFNDTDAELFSIDTYFGLYLKLNTEENDFSCIGKEERYALDANDDNIITSTEYIFDTSIHTFPLSMDLKNSVYENMIYGLSTPKEFIRLNSGLYDAPEIDEYVLKPYKNVLTSEVKKISSETFKSFLIFKLHKLLEIGDHIRVIDIKNNTIYEVVTTNTLDYHDDNGLSDVTTTYSRINSSFYTIKYISMLIPSRKEIEAITLINDTEANPSYDFYVNNQAEQLFYAFKKFNVPEIFSSYKYKTNVVSLLGNVPILVFERICSPSGFTEEQKIYLEEDETENDAIEFFNNVYPDKLILNVDEINWQYSKYIYLYPLHFEVVGNRMAHACGFIQTQSFNDKYLYSVDLPSDDVFDYTTNIYSSYDKEGNIVNKKYEDIKVVTFTEKDNVISQGETNIKYVVSFEDSDKAILNISDPYLRNNVFNLYNSYPLNSGICSIFNLKDFDFSVLDADSYLAVKEDNTPIGEKGEFSKASIFNEGKISSDEDILNLDEETDNRGFTKYYHTEGYDFYTYTGPITKLSLSDKSKKFFYRIYDNSFDIAGKFIHHPTLQLDDNIDITDYSVSTADYVFTYKICNSLNVINAIKGFVRDIHDEQDIIIDVSTDGSSNIPNEPEEYNLNTQILYYLNDVEEPYTSSILEFIYRWDTVNRIKTAGGAYISFTLDQFIYIIGGWVATGIVTSPPKYSIATGYSNNPIRNTSEENVKDYIDKYRLFYYDNNKDISLADKKNISKYFNNLFENNHTKLDISLLSPYACKWKGVGTDARGENLRVMYDFKNINEETGKATSILVDSSSYFVSGSNTYSTYLGYLSTTSKSKEKPFSYKKYIRNSLNELALSSTSVSNVVGTTEKEYILEGNGSVEDILYSKYNSENKFSVAYNAGEDTIEFISSGVKFRIKTNNNDAINISNYNGYSAVFVSLPDVNRDYAKQTELIIDELRKEIMFVWYQCTNTFKFGVSYEPIPNTYDVFAFINPTRYLCRVYHKEDIKNILCTFSDSDRLAIVADDAGFGNKPGYAYTDSNGETKSLRGIQLCKKYGAMWIGSVATDDSKYTKYNRVCLTGTLNPIRPEKTYPIDYTYSYYRKKNKLTLVDPYFWHNYDAADAANGDIDAYAYDYSPAIESFLSTDDPGCIPNTIGTFDDLKKAVLSCAIYIKTDEGKKDYTMYSNLLSISVIEPIIYYKNEGLGKAENRTDKKKEVALGYVHPSYVEPVTIDMFDFNYISKPNPKVTSTDETTEDETEVTTERIETIFKKSFDGGNILLNNVNTIKQIWFNKYTEEFNYCIKQADKTGDEPLYKTKTSIDVKRNVSLMSDSWNSKLYRNYYINTDNATNTDTEYFDYVPGYKTGYELKTFIHSRGINLNGSNGKSIEITSWKNTEISQKNKYIRLDITDSLVYNILFREAFNKYWNYLSLTDNTYKINYIKNTILPLININNKTKFVLYKSDKLLKVLKFNGELDETKAAEILNYKNELKYENGKYYMYVYPEEISVYYAKMIIDL